MTNVEYRCPQCNSRLFAAPGGTRMRCPKCDQRFEQHENFQGEDRYSFRDTKGEVHIPNPDEHAVATMDRGEAKDYLKEQYSLLSGGRRLDGRMAVDDMLAEVQKLRNEKEPLKIDTQGSEI
jgi:hypothetical protein